MLLWAAAAASGAIGWSGRFECLPVALGVLLCWRWSRSRAEALGVGLAYYGAASFGLVNGASMFFGERHGLVERRRSRVGRREPPSRDSLGAALVAELRDPCFIESDSWDRAWARLVVASDRASERRQPVGWRRGRDAGSWSSRALGRDGEPLGAGQKDVARMGLGVGARIGTRVRVL